MRFELAAPRHDPALRALLREHAMPGWVELALEREPDFFAAAAAMGGVSQTVVALDGDTVVGMGCRTVREVYLNGRAASLGYLSGLRLRQPFRGGTALARGYGFLRQLHEDGATPAYLSTIIEGNRDVMALLAGGRAGLPRYRDLGRYVTFAVALGAWTPGRRPRPDVAVSHAAPSELDAVVAFLNEHGRRRQFFPVVRRGDFDSPARLGLQPRRVMTARGADGRIEGVAACWDQSAYKQTRVVRYRRSLATVRPLLNALLHLMGFPALPGEGAMLPAVNLSLVCIRDDDPGTLAALLNGVRAECRPGLGWLMVGLHERDPLCRAVRRWTSLRYASRLYAVYWEDGRSVIDGLAPGHVPYLEVATL
jgi:hypothetical protein